MGVNGSYWTFTKRGWKLEPFSVTLENHKKDERILWSGRIGSGGLGLTDCSAGRRGPRDSKEVLIAPGSDGLLELVYMGFIPCPVCKPEEKQEDFWEIVENTVLGRYDLVNLKDFADKTKLPFDARRLELKLIANIVWGLPRRLYVPKNLSAEEVNEFRGKLCCIEGTSLYANLPQIGFYDPESPTRFTEYKLE